MLSLQRHWRLGLVAALLLLLLGLPVVWIKGQSSYQAESVFQVYPAYQKNLSGDKELEFQSNSQYREFVNHLSRSVVRYDIVERTVKQLKGAGCLPAETERKCIERLQRVIYVLPMPDTYMVRVGLKTAEKGESDQVINQLMENFLETVRDEQIYGSRDRADVLKNQSVQLQKELADYDARRAELAGKLGLTTFTENITNPYDVLLARMREQAAQAQLERSVAKAALDAFEAKREVPMQAGRSVLEMRLQDNGLQALRNEVVKRTEELNRSAAGLEPGHPAFAPATRERDELASRLDRREKEFEKLALDNVRARLTASLLQTQQVEQDVNDRVSQFESKASAFAMDFRSAMQLTASIRKREQELADIRDRSNFLKTESVAIGFARLITPALPAVVPLGVGRVKLGLALLLASFALFFLLPVAIDVLDRRIIAVSDAEKVLGIDSAAWFVDKASEAAAALSTGQFKRFASALVRNRNNGADGVFAFTSARVGGGCTEVVTQAALQLKALGSRVLVVDANTLALNSPFKHDGPGLTDHLAGRAELAEIVATDTAALPGIDVVSVGSLREGGLKRMDRMRQALQAWRQQYDMVLLDIPPLLPSADAELLVDTAKQVFVVVEAVAVSKAELGQLRAQLARQAPDSVGLLVNRVPLEQGSDALNQHILEGITGGRFSRFMSTSALQLRLELIRYQLRLLWSRRARVTSHAGAA
ncbi:MAG: AAA family ATPase [Aquabacterium sp.]|nr:AAA family ATPase [Aquabacterium sp.]